MAAWLDDYQIAYRNTGLGISYVGYDLEMMALSLTQGDTYHAGYWAGLMHRDWDYLRGPLLWLINLSTYAAIYGGPGGVGDADVFKAWWREMVRRWPAAAGAGGS